MSDVTRLLEAVPHGDVRAGEKLLPLVYAELRQLACARAWLFRTIKCAAALGGG